MELTTKKLALLNLRLVMILLLGLGGAFVYLLLSTLLTRLMPTSIATEPIVGASLVMLMVALWFTLQPKVQFLQKRWQQIEESRHELEKAYHRLLVVREEERKSLARELHDGAMQKLSILGHQIDKTVEEIDDPALIIALQEIRAKSAKSLNELRGLCDGLRPPELELFGLATAIECYAEELTGTATISLDLMCDKNLSDEARIALYRIYQAAVTNAHRHAQAQEINVCLHFSQQTAQLTIQDDGQGFIVPSRLTTLVRSKHFGLVGMQERAKALGGDLTIDSTLGVGTTISVSIPLERNKK